MPVPSSGEIKISDLVAEFGGDAPHALSEYYRDAGLVPGNNTNIPTSGQFLFSNAYSAVNEIAAAASSGANVDISSLFGGNWTSTVPKRLTIGSGVTIGGTGSSAAIIIPSNMAGTLEIDNAGTVIGFGGASAGAAGGHAINCAVSGVTINNTGQISGGGGAGNVGGVGGNGSFSSTVSQAWTGNITYTHWALATAGGANGKIAINWNGAVAVPGWKTPNGNQYGPYNGWTYTRGTYYYSPQDDQDQYRVSRTGTTTTSTTGGAGGSFGVGAGYNQSATNGGSGASGGTNAGSGGAGSNGAALGTAAATSSAGANGNVSNGAAGSAGGAAGAAVTGTSVTMNNTGTLNGAVA